MCPLSSPADGVYTPLAHEDGALFNVLPLSAGACNGLKPFSAARVLCL